MRIVVTGGAQGIGFASVETLTHENHDVVVVDKNSEKLKEVKEKLGCETVNIDIANEKDVSDFFDTISEIDALVNNAGIWIPEHLSDMSLVNQLKVVDVNLMGTLYCTKYALPKIKKSSSSVIINLTSAAAKTNSPGLGLYAATKAAIETLTRQWALEVPPIRVNAVGPGLIITEGTAENYQGKARELRAKAVPLKRVGEASDIADVIKFLISDEARYVNGQIIYIDGGLTAGSAGR